MKSVEFRAKSGKRNYHFMLFVFLASCVLCLVSSSAFSQNVEDIRDISGQVDYPVSWLPWIIVLAVILVGIAAFFLWKKYYQPSEKVVYEPKVPAWEVAQAALADLRQKNYPAKSLVKPYYSELSYILRCYIEARFQIDAPEMTTEEFLDSLRFSTSLNQVQKDQLENFLTSCDMVKFAKYGASIAEMENSFELVDRFVKETIIPEKIVDKRSVGHHSAA